MFLNSFIYSLCTRYKPDNINLYIMDFGSETLRMFYGFPQVAMLCCQLILKRLLNHSQF